MKSLSIPTLVLRMQHRAEQRVERFEPTLVKALPSPLRFHDGMVFLGTYSIASTLEKARWIKQSKSVTLHEGIAQTPGEVARDYLAIKYPDKRRIASAQLNAVKVHRAQPIYARPGTYEEHCYLDLTAAYWSLLKIIGWDVDYYPERWLRVSSSVEDFPIPQHKVARNALVMAGISSGARVYYKGKFETRPMGNQYANYSLWSAVQDTLHSIAWVMYGFGAKYINTDGYIIPVAHMDYAAAWLESLGFKPRVDHIGEATVYGVGRYTMGSHVNKGSNAERFAFNLNPHWKNNTWMVDRIKKLSLVNFGI